MQKLREFEKFTLASDMSIVKYMSKFNYLGNYSPIIMEYDTMKMYRFKKDLNSIIKSSLEMFQPKSFADFMGAIIRE